MSYVPPLPLQNAAPAPRKALLPVTALLGAAYFAWRGVGYTEESASWGKRPWPNAELRKHWAAEARKKYLAAGALAASAWFLRKS